jgi:hypothetical protein
MNARQLVLLAQAAAAARHVEEDENREGAEHDERAGIHWFLSEVLTLAGE